MNKRLAFFETDEQKSYTFLKEINNHAAWQDEDNHKALAVLRAVLHELRDCVGVGTSANFTAQLPALIRGLYFEQWDYTEELPKKDRTKEKFLTSIQQNLREFPELNAEDAVKTVIAALKEKLGEPTINKLESNLTNEVRNIWKSEI